MHELPAIYEIRHSIEYLTFSGKVWIIRIIRICYILFLGVICNIPRYSIEWQMLFTQKYKKKVMLRLILKMCILQNRCCMSIFHDSFSSTIFCSSSIFMQHSIDLIFYRTIHVNITYFDTPEQSIKCKWQILTEPEARVKSHVPCHMIFRTNR